jgi:hypothetical protein
MKTFREYVAERDLVELAPMNPQMQAQQANNPANKMAVRNNLMAAQKAAPPAGIDPQSYQAKLKAALNVAKTAPVTNASAAIDIANAQGKVTQ